MSQENVENFKRAVDAINREDIDKLLEELDPEVKWYDVFLMMFGGEASAYRGHEGVREFFRDLFDAFADGSAAIYSEIQDLGDRTVATGSLRTRGNESRAETESLVGAICDYKNDKAVECGLISIQMKPSKPPGWRGRRCRRRTARWCGR